MHSGETPQPPRKIRGFFLNLLKGTDSAAALKRELDEHEPAQLIEFSDAYHRMTRQKKQLAAEEETAASGATPWYKYAGGIAAAGVLVAGIVYIIYHIDDTISGSPSTTTTMPAPNNLGELKKTAADCVAHGKQLLSVTLSNSEGVNFDGIINATEATGKVHGSCPPVAFGARIAIMNAAVSPGLNPDHFDAATLWLNQGAFQIEAPESVSWRG